MSETGRARASMAKWCVGYGLDLGCGCDKITPSAIGVDLPAPQLVIGGDPVQLGGDARDLRWFRDGQLDYVYSSHLLEDFDNTRDVLREWARVLSPGGRLALLLPDERVFRAHCARTGQPPNANHKHADFGPAHVKKAMEGLGLRVVHESGIVNDYSFELVLEKT